MTRPNNGRSPSSRRRGIHVSIALAAAALAFSAVAAAPFGATSGVILDRRACSSCGFLPSPPTAAVLPARSTAAWLLVRRGGGSSSGGSSGSSSSSANSSPPHATSGPDQADTGSPPPPSLLLPVPGFKTEADVLESSNGLMWSRLLVESFQRIVGRPLLPGLDGLDDRALAQALFDAPRVVVSHQTQADPVLCYGNRKALALWEMDLATLTSTPSRLTAEPVERAERQRLLDTVAAQGFINNYEGVRISSTGKRFMIKQCIVWEVFDSDGVRRGQAATFDDIEPL